MLATNVPTLPNFETDSLTLDPIFIGRDEEVSEIVEGIYTSTTTDECLISIFAIVGMGGLGKTTLTRNVFHHPKIKTHFGSRLWVHVSQIFDPIILFKKILKCLTSTDQVEVESWQDILRRLQEALKDKTYLLILDDVWNQDRPKWDEFIISLAGVTSTMRNAIVITTRSMEVASTMQSLYVHELKGLSHVDCWSIIKAKTFGKEDDIPLEFEAIGRKIATRCQGLPLVANAVGAALFNKSQEEWLSVEEKWLSHDEGDHITKVLKLSFDNLSLPSLKKCFACCSIFPKGCKIKSQELIEYWIAEGLLKANGINEMECLGDKFIEVLLHNSLLQVAERDDYGNVESCVMHDLVHDLACSISVSSNNIEGGSRVRYLIHDDESRIPKVVAKYLRTLLFVGNINGNKFADFECLHVLILADDECKKFPSSIRKLIHLRKLDISSTRIKYMPDWIGELHQLQTLNACTGRLMELPSTMKYLINLRHLYIDDGVELPAEIGSWTSLQTLKYFTVGDKNGCKIEELGSMNGLKGKLEISNLERIENKEEAEKASLSNKSKILDLCLRWDNYREGETKNDENVLEGLQPHSDLKKLKIKGFKGKRFPSWTRNMEVEKVGQNSCVPLNNLIEIILVNCFECEEIPMSGQLPNLKTLVLEGLRNVKFINSSVYGVMYEETCFIFPALEKLVLHDMPKLTEWAEELAGASGIKVFPHLQHLMISECNALQYFPCEMIGSSLESLMLENVSSLENLAGIIECLPKSSHLKHLTIFGAPQFIPTCLPEILPLFSSLHSLKLDVSLGGSMENVDALMQVCSSSLRQLKLKGVQGCWENLMESLQHLTALVELDLETIGMEKLPLWLRRISESRQPRYGININGEPIWMPLTELRTLLNRGNPEDEAKEETEAGEGEGEGERSKSGKDWCLSLRCFQRARK